MLVVFLVCRLCLDWFELQFSQGVVGFFFLLRKFGMCILFDDLIIFNNENLVYIVNCSQLVCDDDRGMFFYQGGQCILNDFFGFGIEVGSCFVQQEYGGVFEDGLCNCNMLLLFF